MSPPRHLTNGVVRLVDFPILQSCSNLSHVLKRCIAYHRVNAPVFPRMASQRSGSFSPSSGDHYNSETAGASCWSPRTWHMDDNLGLRREHASPRSDAPRDSGRPNEYARDKRPDLFVPYSASCHATPRRSRPMPQQPCLFAPRYASLLQIFQPRAPHLPA